MDEELGRMLGMVDLNRQLATESTEAWCSGIDLCEAPENAFEITRSSVWRLNTWSTIAMIYWKVKRPGIRLRRRGRRRPQQAAVATAFYVTGTIQEIGGDGNSVAMLLPGEALTRR